MRANFSPPIAISASRGARSPGRTTRTFLMRRSYAIAAAVLRRSALASQALFQMREQAAVSDDLQEERRHRLRGKRLAARAVVDAAGIEVHRDVVAGPNALRPRADKRREAEIDRIAVEEACVRFGDERGDAEMLERPGRLLARRTGAEVAAGDDDIAFAHARGEGRLQRVHAVAGDLVDAVLHVAAGRDDVRVDIVAEDPSVHCSIPRGSVMQPVTADAATVYGE